MIGMTRLQRLERENKDLRIRLENREGKAELALCALEDEAKTFKGQLREKDKVINMLQASYVTLTEENEDLRHQIKILRNENSVLRDTLEKAEDRSAKLAARLQKDSSNSNKPPSSDSPFTKAKATSEKEKSGKKVGGQPGHKGHRLMPSLNPNVVFDRMPPKVCPCCGEKVVILEDYEARQVVDVEIKVTVTEERSHQGQCVGCSKVWQGEFSEGFNSPVGYGSSVKAMVATLNADANVPINKTALFMSSITDGQINMSDGTIVNIIADLAEKLEPATEDIADELAACNVLNVDEAGCSVNGNLTWIQIISNKHYSLFGRSLKRGTPNDTMNNLILLFTGILVHDHLMSYYRYKHLTHGECNVHILRYLKAVRKIMKHPWAEAMTSLLAKANNRKKELIEAGCTGMEEDELIKIRNEYVKILEQGQIEYEAAIAGKKNITYYNEERRLLNRLKEYIDEHLLFLYDFTAPFDNNGAERDCRKLKGKEKTAGCFRSDDGIDNYSVIASVIATLRKQGKNIFSAIRNTFQGVCIRFGKSVNSDK